MNYLRSYFEFKVAEIKGAYPDGCVVRMCADDPNIKMGTIGIVDFVDDVGQVFVCWDDGQNTVVVPTKNQIEKIRSELNEKL